MTARDSGKRSAMWMYSAGEKAQRREKERTEPVGRRGVQVKPGCQNQ